MQTSVIGGCALAAQAQKQPSPRLVRAAHEFEGQMMKQLLQPMTEGDALTGAGDDADAGAGSNGALGEFATEALGQSLSNHGGFGIANRIIQQLSHSGNQCESRKVTQNQHEKHGMRASQGLE